jgi:hypothetical protein
VSASNYFNAFASCNVSIYADTQPTLSYYGGYSSPYILNTLAYPQTISIIQPTGLNSLWTITNTGLPNGITSNTGFINVNNSNIPIINFTVAKLASLTNSLFTLTTSNYFNAYSSLTMNITTYLGLGMIPTLSLYLSPQAFNSINGIYGLYAVNIPITTPQLSRAKVAQVNISGTYTDIWATPSGVLYTGSNNSTTLLSIIGTSSCNIQSWYDQSGKGYDATQTTVGNQPYINLDANGIFQIDFKSNRYFTIPMYTIPMQQSFTLSFHHNTMPYTVAGICGAGNGDGDNNSINDFNHNYYNYNNYSYDNYWGNDDFSGGTYATNNVVSFVYNASTNSSGMEYLYINCNLITSSSRNSWTGVNTTGYIGRNSLGDYLNGELYSLFIFTSNLGIADRTTIETIPSIISVYNPIPITLFNNSSFTSGSYATAIYSLKALNISTTRTLIGQTQYNYVQVLTVYNTTNSTSSNIYADITGNLYLDQYGNTNFNTTGITSTSTNYLVSQWWDQSGNGNHAVQDTGYMSRPYINTGGLSGVYQICFPYISGLKCPYTTFCSPNNNFTVTINHNGIGRNGAAGTHVLFSTVIAGQQTNAQNIIGYNNTASYGYINGFNTPTGNFQTNISSSSFGNSDINKTIITFTHDTTTTNPSTEKLYINGTLPNTGTPSQTNIATGTGWTPFGTFIGASGGAGSGDRNGPLDGELYSLFVFVGSALSDSQRTLVESYA